MDRSQFSASCLGQQLRPWLALQVALDLQTLRGTLETGDNLWWRLCFIECHTPDTIKLCLHHFRLEYEVCVAHIDGGRGQIGAQNDGFLSSAPPMRVAQMLLAT